MEIRLAGHSWSFFISMSIVLRRPHCIIFTSEVLAPVLTALIKEDAPGVWVRFIWRRTTIRCLLNTVGFKMFHNAEKLVLLTRTLKSECLLAILRHVIIWYNMREYAVMSSERGLVHVHCHWNLTGWKTWKMGPFDRGLLTATWDWWPSDCTWLHHTVDICGLLESARWIVLMFDYPSSRNHYLHLPSMTLPCDHDGPKIRAVGWTLSGPWNICRRLFTATILPECL